MVSSMPEFHIDIFSSISHFIDLFVDVHPSDEYVEYLTSPLNIISEDPPNELTQPSPYANVHSTEGQSEDSSIEPPTLPSSD